MELCKPCRVRRMCAFVLDLFLSFLIPMPLAMVGAYLPEAVMLLMTALSVFGVFGLLICRDYLFSGRSLGKRVMGLAVADRQSGGNASGRQLLRKDLCTFIYPLDGMTLLFSGRSLGERASGTAVVRSRAAAPIEKKRLVRVGAVVLVLAVCFAMVLGVALGQVKQTEVYHIASEYLTERVGGEPSLTGFSSTSRLDTDGNLLQEQAFTFRVDGELFTVVCHPAEDGSWQVCAECTELD